MFTTSKTAIRGVRQLVQKLWLGSDIRSQMRSMTWRAVTARPYPKVWMATSGAAAKRKVAPRAYYKRLQAREVHREQALD